MTRRVEILPIDNGWVVKCWAVTEAEAFALQSALVNVPKAAAFVPALAAGPAFDSPEEPGAAWRAAEDARKNRAHSEILDHLAFPPNCDGNDHRSFDDKAKRVPAGTLCDYPQCRCPLDHPGTPGWCAQGRPTAEPTAGEVLAQAAHEAAEDGAECTSTLCALTRGAGT